QSEKRGGGQSADHHYRQALGDQAAVAVTQPQGKQGENGGKGGHQDRTQAGSSRLQQRGANIQSPRPLLLHPVNQHDGIGHHDSDQHQRPDQGGDADGLAGNPQSHQSPDHRIRQGEHDGEGSGGFSEG